MIESLSIIEYLEELTPEGAILGSDTETRAQARDLERMFELRLVAPKVNLEFWISTFEENIRSPSQLDH